MNEKRKQILRSIYRDLLLSAGLDPDGRWWEEDEVQHFVGLEKREEIIAFQSIFNVTRNHLAELKSKKEKISVLSDYSQAAIEFANSGATSICDASGFAGFGGRPIWFAAISLIEDEFNASNNLDERQKYITEVYSAFMSSEIDFNPRNQSSYTGLALKAGRYGFASLLIANDKYASSSPEPIWQFVINSSKQPKRVDMLLKLMDKLYELDEEVDRLGSHSGRSALMQASAYTAIEQINWLLERGADINKRDIRSGATPLMHALNRYFGVSDNNTRKRLRETIDLLISQGADISMCAYTGQDFGVLLRDTKALKPADKKHFREMWKTYKKKGATKNKRVLSDDEISPDLIKKINMQGEFLLHPWNVLLETFFEILKAHKISRFTDEDIFHYLNPGYHGVNLDGIRKIDLASINHWLTRFVCSCARSNVELHCSSEGVYSFSSTEGQARLRLL
ncbi:ankyrin repeat domain-containing protein [Microbulbifer sp. VAAF005]|uniref:ankyrin repeat domain-containing protein n=1 Tax=Microbulbifer sp. VAAF005 TaxID=3034230 RepID=UPI0024ACDBE6|nr:ankyrin repeat domain-containing protein [Microbulbifer sp. VAAF005]WHI48414.1 ankyrin repeat domain-containing protein [Microbulbifer sp. VAAF005]